MPSSPRLFGSIDGAPERAPAQALIFDVQRFSVHDGPGIRTTVFFKGCPLRCRWCQNPESLRGRREIAFFSERCRSERACLASCPSDALRASAPPAEDRITRARCDACGRCVSACPHGAFESIGRTIGADALVEELLRDAPFYASSGGGVTLSGGEPMRQAAFVRELVPRLRARGLSVVLQTCGAFRFADLEPILPSLALVQLDLKIMDEARHRAMTRVSNRRILANARRLVERGAPVAFRIPIIADHTDDDANLEALARFLLELGVPRVHALAGHALGQVKLARLGFPLAPLALGNAARLASVHARAVEKLTSLGLDVQS